MTSHNPEIDTLVHLLSKLPGLGPRSARRAVLFLIKKRVAIMTPLASAINKVADNILVCDTCGNLDTQTPCAICTDPKRDQTTLCVVEDVADLWALDRTQGYKGLYHILGGVLSALDGVRPEDLSIDNLIMRAQNGIVKEVILATNATVDGQTTAHYITDKLQDKGVSITAIAHGVPVGGELDYLDDGTLTAALRARKPF
jgi:recombination protein RecR